MKNKPNIILDEATLREDLILEKEEKENMVFSIGLGASVVIPTVSYLGQALPDKSKKTQFSYVIYLIGGVAVGSKTFKSLNEAKLNRDELVKKIETFYRKQ